jgi:hypothetical protein
MLHAAGDIKGLRLEARDGRIGHVDDLYFDDEDWTVRYLVVSTGSWLSGRRALISPYSLGKPDRAAGVIPVNLTMDQVRDAPGEETDLPVSRQQESRLIDYYGYPYYWRGPYVWGGAAYPYFPPISHAPGEQAPFSESARWTSRQGEGEEGDAHLRSMAEVRGYGVHAVDGDIGHIEDFLIDEDDWSIRYLAVDTRNWLPGRHVAVPAEWARDIRWSDRKVAFGRPREEIRNAPEYSGIGYVTPEYSRNLDDYYAESGRRA